MDIKYELSRFVPATISQDASELEEWEKTVLDKLFDASKIMNEIFLTQVFSKNPEIKKKLIEEGDKDKLMLFNQHYGPFNRLHHNESFIEGYKKPLGANFYPEDITKDEFETFLKEHPEKKEEFKSHLTLIRRDKEKNLIAIHYSEAYKEQLEEASKLVKEASEISENESLKNYLSKLSVAFLKNYYLESDMAWMDLDSRIEPLLGPYEVYEDELMGLKACFEAMISIRDKDMTSQLKKLESVSEELEKNLPIKIVHKEKRGQHSPILAVNLWLSAGDGRAGIHFTAFNLPNDERVRSKKGSKKVMLKNMSSLKFKNCTEKIIERVFEKNIYEKINFDSFFIFVVLHEVSHGIGPGYIRCGQGTEHKSQNTEYISVNEALKETYPTIEECKADALGAYNSYYLEEKEMYEKGFAESISLSYIAGIFRAIRFGLEEAHAGGNIIAYTFLKEQDVISYDSEAKKFKIKEQNIRIGITALAKELLEIEATGDYERAKSFISKYRQPPDELKMIIKDLEDIPIDIMPQYEKDVQ